ncbi:MAG: PEP-CTERM sorting domain-containing protein [Sedimentisphaerales bacterium]|jgi:hypothetical protein
MRKLIAICAVVLFVCLSSQLMGAYIEFRSDAISGYGMLQGSDWAGELKGYVTGVPGIPDGTMITTFCAELVEKIGYGTFNIAAVNTQVITGGVGPLGEPLNPETAWLYAQYLSGAQLVSSNSDGVNMQNAFWALQNDIPAPAAGTNPYYDAAVASGATDLGSIRVLNLTTSDGTLAQDVLIPEPATICLLGLGALSLLRNRRFR